MPKVGINGIQMAFERHGKGTPLVLLHGYPLDHHVWDDIVPLLQDTFDLIIPELRGFGDSTTVDTLYNMDDMATDIAGLLGHLSVQKTAIAGHSMGGYVALAFARHFPKRVTGLGLVSSQVLADPPDRKEGRYKSAADIAENGINNVVETMSTKFTSDPRLQGFAREIMQRQKPAAYIGVLKAMAERPDSTPLLSTMQYPLVVIHGDGDMLIPVVRAREIKEAVPSAHFVEISGAGHLPMMEAKEITAEALKQLA
ncbi:MAG: alpha/beta hydrolase [Anaerolineales bacterium]